MRVSVLLRSVAFGFLLLTAGLAVPQPATAHEYKLGSLEIDHPWARPSTGKTGAAYFVIKNNGATDDALTGIEADVSAKVQMHDMEMDGTIMRMRKLDKLPLPAGQTVKVAPGGLHVMLIGLKAPLKDGDKFPMRLIFEKAGAVDVSVYVQTPEKAAAGMHDMGSMK